MNNSRFGHLISTSLHFSAAGWQHLNDELWKSWKAYDQSKTTEANRNGQKRWRWHKNKKLATMRRKGKEIKKRRACFPPIFKSYLNSRNKLPKQQDPSMKGAISNVKSACQAKHFVHLPPIAYIIKSTLQLWSNKLHAWRYSIGKIWANMTP